METVRREAQLVRSNTLAHASILSVINMISPALFPLQCVRACVRACVYMSVQNGRAVCLVEGLGAGALDVRGISKSTEMKSVEANEIFTLAENTVAPGPIPPASSLHPPPPPHNP